MRLDRFGGKLGALNFLNRLLAQPTLHFLGGERNRIVVGVGRRTGKSPRNVILACGRKLGAVHRDQLGLDAGQLNRLVAVVGDHHEDGKETDFAVVNRKHVCFFRQIVRIHRDRNRFHRMLVVRRIGLGRLRHRHHKLLRREAQQWNQRDNGDHHHWQSEFSHGRAGHAGRL